MKEAFAAIVIRKIGLRACMPSISLNSTNLLRLLLVHRVANYHKVDGDVTIDCTIASTMVSYTRRDMYLIIQVSSPEA